MQQQLSERLALARAIALEAGAITLRYFCRDNYQVELKQDDSPVTVADREAELHLRRRIAEVFPADAILGEEFPEQPGDSGFRWILDPIDGTKSFISGVPFYGTLVGVEHEGQSVVGVIHIPGLAETAYAARGQGAWHARGDEAPRRARVSSKRAVSEGLFLTSDVRGFAEIGQADVYTRLQNASHIARTWGDCYGYVLVATGRAELMVDPKMNVWDCAALQPILEEAGGTFTDWQGTPTIHGGNGIATNGLIQDEVMALVRG
ncbi:MAG TPA: histidinol-phosphatase [Pirellulales bacterium]|jgi:histidinol phosphatase-like enzyme (inositol monophosphatase family)